MFEQEQKIKDLPGKLLLIAFFLLFIAAFSGNSGNRHEICLEKELVIGLNTLHHEFVPAVPFKLSSYQRNLVSVTDRMHIRFLDRNNFILAENLRISRLISTLQKNTLPDKSELSCRFFYHLYSSNFRELPVLS